METTFMTIHNLTPQANILFASESIEEILGFRPEEVTGRSCFDYFHPDEIPFAKRVHSKGVELDKAAVLHYARIRNRNGEWVGCECVFTVVYEVLVGCTSIYKGDAKNHRRAAEAPAIRRLFASSPRDPRYHMLEHLSAKFRTPQPRSLREPRAALILNRFTRTLTVMYATNAVSSILGVSPEVFKDKSFYECMQENCLPEAIRCLESAKANDSIAYLRFWYRDPRRQEDFDQEMREASMSSDSDDGGVDIRGYMDLDQESPEGKVPQIKQENSEHSASSVNSSRNKNRSSSDESTDLEHDASHAIFDHEQPVNSSSSSLLRVTPDAARRRKSPALAPRAEPEAYEIEAVVSCTSDGLVVVLRRARPLNPTLPQPPNQVQQGFANGLFAAPWGANPIRPHQYQPDPVYPFQHGLQAPMLPVGGPPEDEFMNSIREVAVFAWSLAGINGNIASYGHGTPWGDAQPPGGLPIWDPYAQPRPTYHPPENQAMQMWQRLGLGFGRERTNEPIQQEDGAMIVPPYNHHRQEQLLRRQNGYAPAGPMGSDRDVGRQAPIQARIAYVYQEELQNRLFDNEHNYEQQIQQQYTHMPLENRPLQGHHAGREVGHVSIGSVETMGNGMNGMMDGMGYGNVREDGNHNELARQHQHQQYQQPQQHQSQHQYQHHHDQDNHQDQPPQQQNEQGAGSVMNRGRGEGYGWNTWS